MNKIFAVGIISLFVGLGFQPVLSINSKLSDVKENLIISDDLPDIIIEKITIKINGVTGMNNYNCRVKNIGNVKVPGGKFFHLKTVINRIRLDGSIEDYGTYIGLIIGNLPLNPGESRAVPINCEDRDFFRFGFFQFNCIINEEKNFIESNYDNNERTGLFFTLKFFPWSPALFPAIWIPRER